MRLLELFENTYDPRGMREEQVREFIDQNCQQWLREANGHEAYRGLSPRRVRSVGPAFLRSVRPDRIPTNSPDHTQRVYDNIIKQVGGKALRSNSAFVTGNYDQARSYGAGQTAYVVLAVGNFHYTWAREFEDWYMSFGGVGPKTGREREELRRSLMIDRGLPDAIRTGVEIMVAAREMLYIEPELYDTLGLPKR